MCGIVGVLDFGGRPVDASIVQRMTDQLAHRGPDGEGIFLDGSVGLGHRRLAIIDLTPAGAQPMPNEAADVHVVANGEIYNFREMRQDLETRGHRFRSRTDSEVIVHAYEEWGLGCVERLNGMFAFALWDAPRRRLFLARDRYGIKPLYWWFGHGTLVAASEVKALLVHPAVSRGLCYEALDEYFTFQNILTDRTLFDGVRLLPPGCTLTVEGGCPPCVRRYWDFPFRPDPAAMSEEKAADRLLELFVQGVTRQLVSDVPIGAYLSGGIDSGSITAVAVRDVPRLTTFTGGFDLSSASGLELSVDERRSAEMLANLLKTEHYEVVMHAGDMEWVLSPLIWHLEDLRVGQCYPNFYVARLASKFVKVVLSGVGGDELFGGYPWRYYHGLTQRGPEEYFTQYYAFWQRLVQDDDKSRLFNDDVLGHLADHSTYEVFRGVFGSAGGAGLRTAEEQITASLAFELKTFLHGLLIVEDKLSMAHSLETRVPFLDDKLVEFAVQLPISMKLRNLDRTVSVDENTLGKRVFYELQTNEGKAVLRRAMARVIPAETATRIKQGFTAPDASWFRGESIDYINRLLRDPRARIYEFLRPSFVTEVLDQHCSGKVNRRLLIWSLLSVEWWCRHFL